MTPEQKVTEFKKIVEEMAKLYEQKNKNYGDSFGELYKELGPTAGLVPLWNKLHRATSLIKGNKNNFESLEDTFKDLACYAIMNLIALKEEKNLTKDDIAPQNNESIKTLYYDDSIPIPSGMYYTSSISATGDRKNGKN